MSDDLDHLREWIGRTEETEDQVSTVPLAALSATLDRDDAEPVAGDAVPPGWHWLYFLPRARRSELGPDGHAKRGGFLPPVPLPRRMWAGGRLEFLKPLRVSEPIRRVSEILDVTPKTGKTGTLVFVVVRHSISGADGLAVVEEQDLVYREPPDPNAPPPPSKPAPAEPVWTRAVEPDPVLLFRYSALTFNGHRIHYDHRYVTGEEGYPGLIVHGPLIATLLLDLVRCERPGATLSKFDFRAVSPLFDERPFTVNGAPGDDGPTARLWALNAEGALAMTANATFTE